MHRWDNDKTVLLWGRAQQAAFLIHISRIFRDSVRDTRETWAQSLRRVEGANGNGDPAFYSSHTLLNQDQGIRGFLYATNDLCFTQSESLGLQEWDEGENTAASDLEQVTQSLRSVTKRPSATTQYG